MRTKRLPNGLIGLFCIVISCFWACQPGPDPEGPTEWETAVSDSAWHFYHAWLADCANERYVKGLDSASKILTDTATNRISRCIKDPAMVAAFGAESLVWGPVLVFDEVGSSGEYVSKNLMYCLRKADAAGVTYSVGIAGTNGVSSYDWLNEDLSVQDTIPWPGGGGVSRGSQIGLDTLLSLQNAAGQNIVAYLQEATKKETPPVRVAVAGHSLGGALTQVMASTLRQALFAEVAVTAWVYAGPTAGTSAFATKLVNSLSAYYAFDNTLDVVPHAWNTDTLDKLCKLYMGLSICDSAIEQSRLVNGVIKYLLEVSSNASYTAPPGVVTHFTGTPLLMADTTGCGVFENELADAWSASRLGNVYENLNTLYSQCGGSTETITQAEFNQFSMFLSEMGAQHTTAYYSYFLGGSPVGAKLSGYVAGEGGDYIKWDGAIALGNILAKADSFLAANNISDCYCE